MISKETQQPAKQTSPQPPDGWRAALQSPLVICLLLAVLSLAVFAPAARNQFVDYDDPDYVTSNFHVQGGLSWENVRWAFTTGHASNWHPLTWLSHMLDCQFFGLSPAAPHVVNVLFHTVNALLLFLGLRRLTGAHWRSALVAGLFALHPLHVESVAWVSERKDVLSTLFFLLTVGAYARWASHGKNQAPPLAPPRPERAEPRGARADGTKSKLYAADRARREKQHRPAPELTAPPPAPTPPPAARPWFWYGLALTFFVLGLLSKPMLVTLPFALLLLDYWPLGRAAGCRLWSAAGVRCWAVLGFEKIPFFALAAASSVATFIAQKKGGAVSTSLSLNERVANALVSYARYLLKMVWPERLSVLYPHPGHWPAWAVAGSAAMLLAVTALVLWQATRRPYFAVGWLWFLGTMVPVIGLVQVGIQSMADRYTYIPLLGPFVMVVWGLYELVPPRPGRAAVLSLASTAALAACAALTLRQVRFWHDSEVLFRHCVNVTDRNYLAYNNLGFFLSNKGKTAEAMENYLKALAINPVYEDALNNMGYALAGQKKYPEALAYYEAALRIKPNHVEVHNNLGNALSDLGRLDDAIAQYRLALAGKPDHADAHNNLGIALAMQGKLDEAVAHFRDAIRFKPAYASAHSNLGNALAAQHHFDEAIKEYNESLRLNPNDAQAHNNLGNALAEQGRLDDAVAHYTRALELNTNNPEAQFNLGVVLARQGHSDAARSHYTEALRLQPNYPEARRQLESLGHER